MEGLPALYGEVRRALGERLGMRLRPRRFDVRFRPYAGVRATIFDRRGHYEVRMGEILRDAPAEVHESLAKILLAKIDRRLRILPPDRAPYGAWMRSPAVAERHDALRRARGRKRLGPARGTVYDLEVLYDRINRDWFGDSLPRVRLGWSLRPSRHLYGHHDPAHGAIVINRLLDHPRVPQAVVASILLHEMLHVKFGVRYAAGGRRVLHPPELRAEERGHPDYPAARRFLRDLEARRIRLRAAPAGSAAPRGGHPAPPALPIRL